jgi:DNA-binding Lrp family transcriptional regulator
MWAKDYWEYENFWLDLQQKFGEHFSKHHFSVLTEYLEFSRPYLLDKKQEKVSYYTFKKSESIKRNDIDEGLLVFISDNARVSLVEVAKQLNVSVVTAREHLRRLIQEQVIVGFRPKFDLQLLGRQYYKVDIFLNKFEKMSEIRGHMLSHPEVTYAERSLLTSDIEFDIETKNFDSFISIMDSFKQKFPEDIRDYSYYSLIKNYKMRFAPEF